MAKTEGPVVAAQDGFWVFAFLIKAAGLRDATMQKRNTKRNSRWMILIAAVAVVLMASWLPSSRRSARWLLRRCSLEQVTTQQRRLNFRLMLIDKMVNYIVCMNLRQHQDPFCARIWKRADQTDPTGEASTTRYGWNETEQTASSMTSALLESLAATATDDGDSVGVTSADDESGNAWSEDSADI
ncbi:hypothetical protein LSAT2_026193 [Lamellibrachia satsuma]|nr:hypothetical protein LSAT2_026193 [Lamellibrachia satsuma]